MLNLSEEKICVLVLWKYELHDLFSLLFEHCSDDLHLNFCEFEGFFYIQIFKVQLKQRELCE